MRHFEIRRAVPNRCEERRNPRAARWSRSPATDRARRADAAVAQELRLGTRGSQLALWQANTVAARIAASAGPRCRIVVIKTSGDRLQEAPPSDVGGQRLFGKG